MNKIILICNINIQFNQEWIKVKYYILGVKFFYDKPKEIDSSRKSGY